MPINALSIDVEDWFHPELVRIHLGQTLPSERVSKAILPILHLLDRYKTKASFFILGEVAIKCPDVVREIYTKGHEIGSHGMTHRMLDDLGEEGFRKELQIFKNLIQKILGDIEIKGFRAPTFSLHQKTRWALPILKEFGYLYDASLFPVKFMGNSLYGVEEAPLFPYRVGFDNPSVEDPNNSFWEFPAAVVPFGRFKVPVSGGFYLRALPIGFMKWSLKRINRTGPFNLYLHPWECDIHTPRVSLPLSSRWITYYGLHRTIHKLEELLKHFSFSRMDEVLRGYCRC